MGSKSNNKHGDERGETAMKRRDNDIGLDSDVTRSPLYLFKVGSAWQHLFP